MNENYDLLNHLEKLHTTELGAERIRKNLSLDTSCITEWCKKKINSSNSVITRKGKNWYIDAGNCVLTVNAHSYTIITAHKKKNSIPCKKHENDFEKNSFP